MKSILIISFWNPTPQSPTKGVFIHDQVEAICKAQKDIVFLEVNILPSTSHLFHKEIIESELYENIKITFNIYSIGWKILYLTPWLIYFYIKKFLSQNHKNLRPNLIHSNIIYPCGIVGNLLARHYNAKHIISEHWSNATTVLKHPVFGRAALRAYKNSKAIICVSKYLATKIANATKLQNIKVIPNIIDTGLFVYVPKKPIENTFHFTCCATWEYPKRLDLIVHSLIKLAALNPTIHFVLNAIGEGSQKEESQQVVLPNNFHIFWLGYIPKSEIATVLGTTDFQLHASETETFSIVTAEALATGTPVLASNTGALPELIDPSNGVLVDNHIDAWIKGLSTIMETRYNHKDIAQKLANKYSPNSIAQQLIAIYESELTD